MLKFLYFLHNLRQLIIHTFVVTFVTMYFVEIVKIFYISKVSHLGHLVAQDGTLRLRLNKLVTACFSALKCIPLGNVHVWGTLCLLPLRMFVFHISS